MDTNLYLHAGGPLHGKLSHVAKDRHIKYYVHPRPIDMVPFGREEVLDFPFDQYRYDRVDTDLFGKKITVFVCAASGRVPDLLFDVLVSSVAKSTIED